MFRKRGFRKQGSTDFPLMEVVDMSVFFRCKMWFLQKVLNMEDPPFS